MSHMPATGVSGLDVYGLDSELGWRWLGAARPTSMQTELSVGGLPDGARDYRVYLPLYNGVAQLEVGVSDGDALESAAPRAAAPVVAYGTSILMGGCASRPGMAFTNIVERKLRRPVMNFGFSGNGRMEAEVGALLAELKPAAFVVDCLPNMNPKQVAERTVPLVEQLRAARPATPILLVEDRSFEDAFWRAGRRDQHATRRAALRGS